MFKKFLYITLFLLPAANSAQNLYFSNSNVVIKLNLRQSKIDTLWQAHFELYDVFINKLASHIGFTKYEDEHRFVGIYNIGKKQYKMIKTASDNNYNLVLSPSAERAAFNTWMDNGWELAVLNTETNHIAYDLFMDDDSFSPLCWQNDSVLRVITFKGFYDLNVNSREQRFIKFSADISQRMGLPGTKVVKYSETVSFMNLGDYDTVIEGMNEPPTYIYKITNGQKEKLLDGKINTGNFFLYNGKIYFEFEDYSAEDVKYRIAEYTIDTKKIKYPQLNLKGTFSLIGCTD